MKLWLTLTAWTVAWHAVAAPFSTNGNRLAYLDSDDPFYPGRDFPRLITPQWVGEEGVEAVIILSIDDMRETPKYETFLRPILERLKKIDGRAPVSIMVNTVSPTNAQLQSWLKEGVSLECHTISHPCPLCQKGDFGAASLNYHESVDLLNTIPGNQPVAFRMPCCDSMNSPSPRFYSEIFNRTSPQGKFLGIDSSVMVVLTTNDTSLPRELVLDADGRERFRKYLPGMTANSLSPQRGEGWERPSAPASANAAGGTTPHPNPLPVEGRGNQTRVSMGSFTTTIEDYPYPYVIGKTCWEFPAIVPSDWEAQNIHGVNNPKTIEDWQRALDAIVLKQGVMTFIFHPHGWIKSEQMVEFIDYAVTKYGRRVKFLNFKEAQERLDRNIGELRTSKSGEDNGVRLVDVNNDGFLDVLNSSLNRTLTQIWQPDSRRWAEELSAFRLTEFNSKFGILNQSGLPSTLFFDRKGVSGLEVPLAFTYQSNEWRYEPMPLPPGSLGQLSPSNSIRFPTNGDWSGDVGCRLRDLDHDGVCELIVGFPFFSAIYRRETNGWRKLDYALPSGMSIVDAQGRDAGLRFVDVDGDGYDDVLFSNHERYSLHLFRRDSRDLRLKAGWTDEVLSGPRVNPLTDPIPPIVRDGTNRNNGVWFKNGTMWIQNEDTAHLPDKVDRRTFQQWLTGYQPRALSPEESLRAMQVRPGFKVELVASEPLIQSPVAFEWSADGRFWVVEMGDYPNGIDGRGKPGGRVRVLEDTDGDGRYDKATTFLEGLNFPNGLYPWRNGVVISAAPEIFYAEERRSPTRPEQDALDTPGRRPALQVVREILFTGFNPGNQQHRANGFDYGLDGWLYGANGDSGGNVRAVGLVPLYERAASLELAVGATRELPVTNRQHAGLAFQGTNFGSLRTVGSLPVEGRGNQSASSVNLRGQDFRIQPDRRLIETIEGQTQFGRHRDDYGNWFGNNNPAWLWHYTFPAHYLARNPLLPLKTTKKMLANYAESTRCFPASRTLSRFNDAHTANHVTSGNSPTPYRDELFGREFATSIFISEPVHNLVHREVLEADGVSFTSHRAADETNREFLASSDNWFRPTMLKTGPDGALYIADMYRLVLEHPEWIPQEMQARLDLRAGADKGRIYRVVPEGVTLKKVPNLAKMTGAELAAALDSPNGWQRDTAQRLLLERGDKSAAGQLESLAKGAKSAKVRVQALWTLSGLAALTPEMLLTVLKDNSAAVREHAVKLSESILLRALSPHPGPLPERAASFPLAVRATRELPVTNRQHADPAGQGGDTAANNLRAVSPTPSPRGEGRGEGERSGELAHTLLSSVNDSDPRVRFQLAFTLGEWNDPRAADALVKLLHDDDENIRNAALSSAPRHAQTLLALIEKLPSDNPTRAHLPMLQKLMANPPAPATPTKITERTRTLTPEQRAERARVLARYTDVPKMKGDTKNGAVLFQQNCAQCHRLRGEGVEVGPDLGMMVGKPVEQLIEAILDPNAALEARYQNFTAWMKDGREAGGIIITETPTTLTLRAPNKADETILRGDLKELAAGGLSLMPEGLENAFTPQQLADLIAFVTGK